VSFGGAGCGGWSLPQARCSRSVPPCILGAKLFAALQFGHGHLEKVFASIWQSCGRDVETVACRTFKPFVFGSLQWPRRVSRFELLESDGPIAAWRERMLERFDGMGRKARTA
jgi:hypothetical protein